MHSVQIQKRLMSIEAAWLYISFPYTFDISWENGK